VQYGHEVTAMYVCICNGITEKAVREAAAAGVSSLTELTMRTGCAATCGSCAQAAEAVLFEAMPRVSARPFGVPLIAAAA
jgi:bacterioferritin-associated ferredoxin